jgi:hypothetical protein
VGGVVSAAGRGFDDGAAAGFVCFHYAHFWIFLSRFFLFSGWVVFLCRMNGCGDEDEDEDEDEVGLDLAWLYYIGRKRIRRLDGRFWW